MTFTQGRRRYFSYLYSYGKRITTSSGGNSPITLSTTLAAGPVKSNELERLYRQLLGGAEVSGTLAVGNGGTGAVYYWWFT
jgi:hypothetical protein